MELLKALSQFFVVCLGMTLIVFGIIGYNKPSLINAKHKLAVKFGQRGTAIIGAAVGFVILLIGLFVLKGFFISK
jgi:hypothetical protein